MLKQGWISLRPDTTPACKEGSLPSILLMTDQRLFDPQQINLYAYCRNNPLAFIDPTGEDIDYANEDSRKAFEEYEKFLNTDPKKKYTQD